MRNIDTTEIEPLAIGGAILGGGGGGDFMTGMKTAKEALKQVRQPTLIDLRELADDDLILTISAVGAPSAQEQYVSTTDYQKILRIFEQNVPRKIKAFITNEMGGGSSFNAFIPSALNGLPMVDAACNGRAHPLGTMGAMGLAEKPYYVTDQVAVGGNPAKGKHIELWSQGSIQATSSAVRNAAVSAGGLVIVARNVVSKKYIEEHAAIAALSQSSSVGSAFLAGKSAREKVANVAQVLAGEILCEGVITKLVLSMEGGLDKGFLEISSGTNHYTLRIWNEYMAAEKNGQRLATFPDLLMTFDSESGLPVTSAELVEGQKVRVLVTSHQHLKLGAGMFEKSGYEAIEKVLGIEMVKYNSAIIKSLD